MKASASSKPKINTFTANTGLSSSAALAIPVVPLGTCNIPDDHNSIMLSWQLSNVENNDNNTLSISQQIGTLDSSYYSAGSYPYLDLLSNTTFVMNAVNAGGVATTPLPIFVQPRSSAVSIANVTASATSVTSGGSVTISWTISSGVSALWLGALPAGYDLSTLGNLTLFDPSVYTNLSNLIASGATQYTVPNVTQSTQFVLFAQDVVGPYTWFPTPSTSNNSIVQVF